MYSSARAPDKVCKPDFCFAFQIRKEPLDSFEASLTSSPECAGSPTPKDFEEERDLLDMEEVKSNASASVAGSTHSLYPTVAVHQEVLNRSESAMSGQSDFKHVTAEVIVEERVAKVEKQVFQQASYSPEALPPPIVDMDEELQLSALSIDKKETAETKVEEVRRRFGTSSKSRGRSSSGSVGGRSSSSSVSTNHLDLSCGMIDTSSPTPGAYQARSSSFHSLYRLSASCGSCHSGNCSANSQGGGLNNSRSESRLDHLLVLGADGKLTSSADAVNSAEDNEADRNVTELTFANSPFKDVADEDEDEEDHSAAASTGGSDSGFSDPSPEASARDKTPSLPEEDQAEPAAAAASVRRKSPLSDIDSIDIVPSLPQPSPDHQQQQQQQQQRSSPPSPSSSASSTRSNTGPRRRRSNRSTGSSVKIEDAVTILESETVKLIPSSTAPATVEEYHSRHRSARPATPERYSYARATPQTRARERTAYVPPRALAPLEEEDEEINKGCYYFMACLDSFWIL